MGEITVHTRSNFSSRQNIFSIKKFRYLRVVVFHQYDLSDHHPRCQEEDDTRQAQIETDEGNKGEEQVGKVDQSNTHYINL